MTPFSWCATIGATQYLYRGNIPADLANLIGQTVWWVRPDPDLETARRQAATLRMLHDAKIAAIRTPRIRAILDREGGSEEASDLLDWVVTQPRPELPTLPPDISSYKSADMRFALAFHTAVRQEFDDDASTRERLAPLVSALTGTDEATPGKVLSEAAEEWVKAPINTSPFNP
jgi:hypothetical protein